MTAPAHLESEKVLAERLLDELALITSEESTTDLDPADRRAAQMEAKLRRDLPDILRDPVVRRRFTREGAVVPRLVGLALRGRRDRDGLDDDAIQVTHDDLPVAFEEIGQASHGAQRLLTQFASVPELKAAAVDLINGALPSAVKRVFVSDQVDLVEVFREVRRELLASGKELVLFIEDLTVLHGVEREFLDAIVEPARSPYGDLCPLRILFAVTEGHFDGLDTVRTRCDDAYWLDASYGPDGVDNEEAQSFIGRYLNACRLDPSAIEQRWSTQQGDSWLPNACSTCDHQVHCHEAFGASEEGYGLYPYNPPAIDRFVSALCAERFDPRDVVRELASRFLIVAATDLSRGAFPSDELVAPFNERTDHLDPLVQSELRSNRPADADRLLNAVRYWSSATNVVADATLEAFGLAPLKGLETSSGSRDSEKPARRGSRGRSSGSEDTPDTSVESLLRAQWSSVFRDLGPWAANQRQLGAAATNHVKKLVHKSILLNLDFSSLPINLGGDFDDLKRFDRERHLFIEGSVTDQRRGDPMVIIGRDADTAAALQGLILLQELPDLDDYPRADSFRRQAARYLEDWVSVVTDRLQRAPNPTATDAVVGLLVCAAVSGSLEKASDPHQYLAALFSVGNSAVKANRSFEWQTVVKAAAVTYQRLRPTVEAHFAEARGSTGGPRAVRADQILTVIREFTDSWQLQSTDAATDRFMRSVAPAVAREWEVLKQLSAGAAPLVEGGRSWTEQTTRVIELVEEAHRHGRLPDHEAASDLRALASSLDDNAHRLVLEAADLVTTDPPLIEQLRVVASDLPRTVMGVSRFAMLADRAMSGIADDLDARRTRDLEGETLEEVASGVLGAVVRIAAVVEELEK